MRTLPAALVATALFAPPAFATPLAPGETIGQPPTATYAAGGVIYRSGGGTLDFGGTSILYSYVAFADRDNPYGTGHTTYFLSLSLGAGRIDSATLDTSGAVGTDAAVAPPSGSSGSAGQPRPSSASRSLAGSVTFGYGPDGYLAGTGASYSLLVRTDENGSASPFVWTVTGPGGTVSLGGVQPNPEPSSLALLGLSGAGLGVVAWRRRRR